VIFDSAPTRSGFVEGNCSRVKRKNVHLQSSGFESAKKVLDPNLPANELMKRTDLTARSATKSI